MKRLGLLRRGGVTAPYVLSLAVQTATPLLLLPVVTRLLTPSAYGAAVTALAAAQVTGLAMSLGLPAAVTRWWFVGETGQDDARTITRWGCLASGTATALLAVTLVSLWLASRGSPHAAMAPLLLALPGAWGLCCTALGQAYLRAARRGWGFLLLTILVGVGAHAAATAAVAVWATTEAYVAAWSLVTLTGVVAAWRLSAAAHDWRRVVSAALRFSLPVLPHSLALVAMVYGSRLLLAQLTGTDDVAHYQIVYVYGAAGLALVAALNNVWAPAVYARSDAARGLFLRYTTDLMLSGAAVFAMLSAAAAPWVLPLLVPPEYEPERLVLPAVVLATAAGVQVLYLSSAHLVFWSGRTRAMAFMTPVIAVLELLVNLVLIPRLGLLGPALASLLSITLLAAGMRVLARRRAPHDVVPVTRLPVPFAVGAAVVLATALLLR